MVNFLPLGPQGLIFVSPGGKKLTPGPRGGVVILLVADSQSDSWYMKGVWGAEPPGDTRRGGGGRGGP